MPLVRKKNSPFLWYDFRFAGRRYRGSTRETTIAAARTFEASLLERLSTGRPTKNLGRRAPLLREFLPRFSETMEANQLLSPKTKLYYRNGIRLLRATRLTSVPIDQLTRSVVAGASFPGSGSNANNAIRTLRVALSLAVEFNLLHTAPSLSLHEERTRRATFSPQQEEAFLAAADRDTADAFILLIDSGLRPEECCRAEVDWIKWDLNLIRVDGGKTAAASRDIPMSTRAREMLVDRLKRLAVSRFANHRAGRFIFPSSNRAAKHIALASLQQGFNRAKCAAGLPSDLVLYSTRHTFGTDMAELADPKLTMITMGHTELKTTARYQHPETAKVAIFLDRRNAKRKSAATVPDGHAFGHTQEAVN